MKRESLSVFGGPSLLVSFGILLLTLLALLTLTQAQADRRLAQRSAENVRAYYAAELEAQEILAQLRSGDTVPGVTMADGAYCWQCPVSAWQTLYARVDAQTWEVICWQVVAHPAAPNEDLPVWTG